MPQSLEEKVGGPPEPKNKFLDWIKRYAPAEIAGTVAALGGAAIAYHITESEISSAYGGTLGENLGFYGVMIIKEVRNDMSLAQDQDEKYGARNMLRTARNLLTEFGPSEALDSLVIRPAAMGVGSRVLGRNIGVLAGKLAADVFFYVPAVISYETRKYLEKRKNGAGC